MDDCVSSPPTTLDSFGRVETKRLPSWSYLLSVKVPLFKNSLRYVLTDFYFTRGVGIFRSPYLTGYTPHDISTKCLVYLQTGFLKKPEIVDTHRDQRYNNYLTKWLGLPFRVLISLETLYLYLDST